VGIGFRSDKIQLDMRYIYDLRVWVKMVKIMAIESGDYLPKPTKFKFTMNMKNINDIPLISAT